MKKKTAVLGLTLLLAISLLAGCGNSSSSSGETASSDGSAEPSAEEVEEVEALEEPEESEEDDEVLEEPAEEPEDMDMPEESAPEEPEEEIPAYFPLDDTETISYWTTQPPIAGSPDEYLIFTEVQERLNIKLDITAASLFSANDEFSLMLVGGDYCDIINQFGMFYDRTVENALEQEIIIDLTDVIEEYAPDYTAARTATETLAAQTLDDDKILEFYMLYSGATVSDFGPGIRQDWLDALNLDTPVTLDDWHDTAAIFKEEYGATMAMPATGTVQSGYLSAAYDITLPDANGTVSGGFYHIGDQVCYGPYSENLLDYLTMVHDWYEEGLIYPDFVSDTNGNQTASGQITSGESGIFWISTESIAEYNGSGSMNVQPIADPLLTEDQTTHMRSVEDAPVGNIVISSSCENVELAVRFMNWWYTDEGSELANYGVEGMTFEYAEDGSVLWTELVTNNEELSQDGALTQYTASRDTITYLYDNDKYNSLFDDAQNLAGELWMANNDGAYAMPTDFAYNEEEEAVSLMGDITTYCNENILKFIIGERDLSEFDDYLATLKDMGMETVLDVYSSRYVELYS